LASDAVTGTDPIGMPSIGRAVRDLGAAFTQVGAVTREGTELAAELLKIARGSSSVTPEPRDWRFKDPAWSSNPLYRRLAQSYLAGCSCADGVLDEFARDGHSAATARFLLNVLETTVAPTNTLLGNPAAVKRTFDTGGLSVLRGARNFMSDLRHNGGMPSTVDRSAFEVGRDLGLTPGAVVDRDAVGEVLQYTPASQTVYERPVLIVPPPIGRFYFLDLRPGRSFVEYSVSRGLQTFMLSWRNPSPEQGDWDLETYARRVLSAIEVVREVTGSREINTIGFCAGGILMTLVLNHLAALGDDRVRSASYAVTLLDFGQPAPIRAFSSPKLLNFARWNSRRTGVISARDMGNVFLWMRPNELIWNYWVNNYLMGDKPPAFDILAWNADGTNLPAALHAQFLEIFQHNLLCEPGALTVLGTAVDLGSITLPTFVTGALTDHLTPWTGWYRTTQLLGGPSTFILSNAGHIQSLVNPPGNAKASYYSGSDPADEPEAWLDSATKQPGTWWTEWADWVIGQAGESKPAPDRLGSDAHPTTDPAPGLYVRDIVPPATLTPTLAPA